jgi:hypothetical protein
MKHFVLLSVLFALLLAALLIGTAFAQQAPPSPTSPQAGDMIPDATTTAAFAAQSTPLESASNAGTQWQILQRQAYGLAPGSQTAQSGLATAQSQTLENNASNAQAQWQIAQRQAYGLAQESQTAQLAPSHFDDSIEAPQVAAAMQARAAAQGAQTTQLAPSNFDDSLEARDAAATIRAMAAQGGQAAQLAPSNYDDYVDARQVAILQSMRTAQGAQAAQLAPSHFDDSIEAPQVAAAMRAMAAIHVPSMEAIRLAQASAKAAAQEKSQEARLQDPTLATPAQSAQTAQLAPSQYDSPGGLVTSAQATELGLPALAAAKEMAPQGAQSAQLATSHPDEQVLDMQVMMQALRTTQAALNAGLATSQYDEEAATTQLMAQSLALGTPQGALAAQLAPSQPQLSVEAAKVAAAMQAAPAQSAQTAQLASSQYDSPGGLVTSAQATELRLPALAAAKEMAPQGAQTAQLAPSHYDSLGALTSAQARALGLPALAGIKEMAEEKARVAILQDPAVLALVQAEEASQSQHVGLTVGDLASAESQHEATESPVEAAFEAAEAAHNPGVSMLAPSHYGSLGTVTSAQARALGLPALAGVKEMAEQQSRLARLQDPTLATPATQASQDGQTAGGPVVLPTAAALEQEEEAAESPAEVAFEEAEAAQTPGLSMSRVHSQGPETAIPAWALTLPALTVNACSNSLAIACTANGTRPALAVR